jgi:hypothetical protein
VARSYPWDTGLAAAAHAQVDAEAMLDFVEDWCVRLDAEHHSSSVYLDGRSHGNWYPANAGMLARTARLAVEASGSMCIESAVLDRLISLNRSWADEKRGEFPLGDFRRSHLLEVVDGYRGVVAGINLTYSQGLTDCARLARFAGRAGVAEALEREAGCLGRAVRRELFRPDTGFFDVVLPDGRRTSMRHGFDLAMALNTPGSVFSEQDNERMRESFRRELRTPAWMHAASPFDGDCGYTLRADHAWAGSYPAWPAWILRHLWQQAPDMAAEWLPGLARTGGQGVFGQAHLVETVFPPLLGGARKAPAEDPLRNEWYNQGGAAFLDAILEGYFGLQTRPGHPPTASPRGGAVLEGWMSDGKRWIVRENGVTQPWTGDET